MKIGRCVALLRVCIVACVPCNFESVLAIKKYIGAYQCTFAVGNCVLRGGYCFPAIKISLYLTWQYIQLDRQRDKTNVLHEGPSYTVIGDRYA